MHIGQDVDRDNAWRSGSRSPLPSRLPSPGVILPYRPAESLLTSPHHNITGPCRGDVRRPPDCGLSDHDWPRRAVALSARGRRRLAGRTPGQTHIHDTDRLTDGQTVRWTHTQTDRQTHIHDTNRLMDGQTVTWTHTHTHTHRQTDRRAGTTYRRQQGVM